VTFTQVVTPNPDIPCTPGYCLQYVRQAFNLPARYGSATEAWDNSTTQHLSRDVPAGVWTPVWYGLDREPLGHVVLQAPDGSVYSTSDNSTTPHHHPDLADLEAYYAGWGWPLTWRGWTEDVAGYTVITDGGLAAMGSIITTQEDDMGTVDAITEKTMQDLATMVRGQVTEALADVTKSVAFQERFSVKMLEEIAAKSGVIVDSAAIAADIRAQLAAQIGGTK
jgi:hypothetical protein